MILGNILKTLRWYLVKISMTLGKHYAIFVKYFENIWKIMIFFFICGLYLDNISMILTIFGQYFENVSTIFGRYLENILTIFWGQAGAELGQAQLKLGFDFTLVFWKFDFSESSPKILTITPFSKSMTGCCCSCFCWNRVEL